MSKKKTFLTDIETIRKRARKHMEMGAVTPSYEFDVDKVVNVLNDALATELVCVLRYRSHYYMASGINAELVADEFLEHSNEEQAHADAIAKRIVQLGGVPILNPDTLTTRSHSQYLVPTELPDMIRENLVAERIAIETYREIIQFLGTIDPTSRKLMEDILAVEEEHADEMAGLIDDLEPKLKAVGETNGV